MSTPRSPLAMPRAAEPRNGLSEFVRVLSRMKRPFGECSLQLVAQGAALVFESEVDFVACAVALAGLGGLAGDAEFLVSANEAGTGSRDRGAVRSALVPTRARLPVRPDRSVSRPHEAAGAAM